jgi:hypothetical protein
VKIMAESELPMVDDDQVDWSVVLDPSWEPSPEGQPPPPEVMVGGWVMYPDGKIGRFHPNPGYIPSSPQVATDPVHAVLRLVLRQEAEVDELVLALWDSMLDVAADEQGDLVFGRSPDGVPCALVTTSAAHHRPELSSNWWQLTLEEILEALPDGVDVLVNPGAPESVRLLAEQLRERVFEGEEQP